NLSFVRFLDRFCCRNSNLITINLQRIIVRCQFAFSSVNSFLLSLKGLWYKKIDTKWSSCLFFHCCNLLPQVRRAHIPSPIIPREPDSATAVTSSVVVIPPAIGA